MQTILTDKQKEAISDFFNFNSHIENKSEFMDNILQDALYHDAQIGGEYGGDYFLFFRALKKMVLALEPITHNQNQVAE